MKNGGFEPSKYGLEPLEMKVLGSHGTFCFGFGVLVGNPVAKRFSTTAGDRMSYWLLAEWFSPNFAHDADSSLTIQKVKCLGTKGRTFRRPGGKQQYFATIATLVLSTISYGSSTALSQQRQRIKQHYRFMLATQLARLLVPELSIRRVWCFHRRGQDS